MTEDSGAQRAAAWPAAATPSPRETVPADPPSTDNALLERLRHRDEVAFAGWVEGLYKPMLQAAVSQLGRGDAAEEAVQEAWILAIRRLHTFKGRGSLRRWVFKILERSLAEGRRKGQRRGRLLLAGLRERRIASDPVTVAVTKLGQASSDRTPEHLFLAAEGREALLTALGRLPRRQQVVLRLRDIEGFSCQEVSEALGITRGAVRSLHFRARASLRSLLVHHLEGHDP